jgi:hypothetical protein
MMTNLERVLIQTIAYWYGDTDEDTRIPPKDMDELIVHLAREVTKLMDEQPDRFAVLYYNQISSVWNTRLEAERAASKLTQGGIVVPIPAVRSGI